MQENQTIEEYKKDKKELEKSMIDLIHTFQRRYGSKVEGIAIEQYVINTLGDEQKWIIENLIIEVNL